MRFCASSGLWAKGFSAGAAAAAEEAPAAPPDGEAAPPEVEAAPPAVEPAVDAAAAVEGAAAVAAVDAPPAEADPPPAADDASGVLAPPQATAIGMRTSAAVRIVPGFMAPGVYRFSRAREHRVRHAWRRVRHAGRRERYVRRSRSTCFFSHASARSKCRNSFSRALNSGGCRFTRPRPRLPGITWWSISW